MWKQFWDEVSGNRLERELMAGDEYYPKPDDVSQEEWDACGHGKEQDRADFIRAYWHGKRKEVVDRLGHTIEVSRYGEKLSDTPELDAALAKVEQAEGDYWTEYQAAGDKSRAEAIKIAKAEYVKREAERRENPTTLDRLRKHQAAKRERNNARHFRTSLGVNDHRYVPLALCWGLGVLLSPLFLRTDTGTTVLAVFAVILLVWSIVLMAME
ncbi:MAG: hypothetical protein ACXABY_26285 [Candidatus Thorarchaeota archaeon]|jgi:hypothetical protein